MNYYTFRKGDIVAIRYKSQERNCGQADVALLVDVDDRGRPVYKHQEKNGEWRCVALMELLALDELVFGDDMYLEVIGNVRDNPSLLDLVKQNL